MTIVESDNFGVKILNDFGAKSAPYVSYVILGCTCISVNNEFGTACHLTKKFLLKEI